MLEAKAKEIADVTRALRDLADKCDGDHRPNCPIIDDLAQIMQVQPSDGILPGRNAA